jgi:S-DNA-T family DNA segregation ATPase FtsK/SpoIIIE
VIRDGLVRVRMIDLKGGTETELGKPLFHRHAVDLDSALELSNEARDEMKADQQRMSGTKPAAMPSPPRRRWILS